MAVVRVDIPFIWIINANISTAKDEILTHAVDTSPGQCLEYCSTAPRPRGPLLAKSRENHCRSALGMFVERWMTKEAWWRTEWTEWI